MSYYDILVLKSVNDFLTVNMAVNDLFNSYQKFSRCFAPLKIYLPFNEIFLGALRYFRHFLGTLFVGALRQLKKR